MKKNDLPKEDYSKCTEQLKNIAKYLDLEIENLPTILYGAEAERVIQNYGDKGLLDTYGAFLYESENLPDKYKEQKVICLVEPSVATLVHELVHYRQFVNDSYWMKKNFFKKLYYFMLYEFYPSEMEAYFTTRKYLLQDKELIKEGKKYTRKIVWMYVRNTMIVRIGVLVLIYLLMTN